MVGDGVSGLGVGETLDAVGLWHAQQTWCEARTFVAAAHFADLHCPDTRGQRCGGELPGMERAIRLGGVGTPEVWEFASAVFGPRIGVSPYSAARLMADALDTRHRLPRLWARVGAGEVPVRYARHVAQQTRDLSVEAAGFVDAAVVGYADGRITWSRFESLVVGRVVAADPERAARLEREAAEAEFARVGQTNDHGQKTLYVRSCAAAIIRIEATIAFYAQILAALGDPDDEDRRRAKAMLILANPQQALQMLLAFGTQRATTRRATTHDAGSGDATGPGGDEPDPDHEPGPDDALDFDGSADEDEDGGSDAVAVFLKAFRPHEITTDSRFRLGFDPSTLLPRVTLYLHLYAADGTHPDDVGSVVRWEGEGPVTTQYVRDVLGPHTRFTIRPVLDPAGLAPVDGYEIPDRHREAVHLRTPADIFPFATNTSRRNRATTPGPTCHPIMVGHRARPACTTSAR
ncbi:MAG: hypothetical protein ACRDUV_14895 [Pseudonocardiaceae bacterium]